MRFSKLALALGLISVALILSLVLKPLSLFHTLGLTLFGVGVISLFVPAQFKFWHMPAQGHQVQVAEESFPEPIDDCTEAYHLKYGIGVERDVTLAYQKLQHLAKQKNATACYELANCYHEGIGTVQNPLHAIAWYQTYQKLTCSTLHEQPTPRRDVQSNIDSIVKELQNEIAFRDTEPKTVVNTYCQLGLYFHWYATKNSLNDKQSFLNLSNAKNMLTFNPVTCQYYFDTLYELGCCYMQGIGTPIDCEMAKRCYETLYKKHGKKHAFYAYVTSLLRLGQDISFLSSDFIMGYMYNIPEISSTYEEACSLHLCPKIAVVEQAKEKSQKKERIGKAPTAKLAAEAVPIATHKLVSYNVQPYTNGGSTSCDESCLQPNLPTPLTAIRMCEQKNSHTTPV